MAGRCCPLLVALGAAIGVRHCDAVLVGASVLPHGDFAYYPGFVNGTGGSLELHRAALAAGRFLAGLKPDVLLLTTPHGLELDEEYLVYLNSQETGSAPLTDIPHSTGPQSVSMNFSSDVTVAKGVLQALKRARMPVAGLQGFADSLPLPISWGEILPLAFVANATAGKLPAMVVLSIPLRRYNHSSDMVPELLQLGALVADYLEGLPVRAAWLVSADLAHTHLASGPYGFCPCAQPYDDAVGDWATGAGCGEAGLRLTRDANMFQRQGAASCGFTGLVALQGALQGIQQIEASRDAPGTRPAGPCSATSWPWNASMLANHHPTYYGMMVANFERAGATGSATVPPTILF